MAKKRWLAVELGHDVYYERLLARVQQAFREEWPHRHRGRSTRIALRGYINAMREIREEMEEWARKSK